MKTIVKPLSLTLVILFLAVAAYFVPRPRPVRVICQTTQGEFMMEVHPEWSPLGARRFLQMVDERYFSRLALFRCLSGFLCQFGAGGKDYPPIADDPKIPALRAFKPGFVSFAGSGPDSRAKHIFISLSDAPSLGSQPWETPLAVVTPETMATVLKFYTGYGEIRESEFVAEKYPRLDWIRGCARSVL